MPKPAAELAALARSGARIAVRVTPRAARNRLRVADGKIGIQVTAAPEAGKATAAARTMLARALGIAKSRLTLIRGATARDKLFRID